MEAETVFTLIFYFIIGLFALRLIVLAGELIYFAWLLIKEIKRKPGQAFLVVLVILGIFWTGSLLIN